jgi:hypothetical protein
MAETYTYPDKMSFRETVMFHIRCMSSELSADGLDNEFEDMVDMLGWLTWSLMEKEQRTQWDDYDAHLRDIQRAEDPIKWGKAKRRRCRDKMRLVMDVLDGAGLLHKKVQEFDPEAAYHEIPVEGA